MKNPKGGTKQDLYLCPMSYPTKNQWSADQCIGVNPLRAIVNRLCKLAGFPGNNFRNHSLRVLECIKPM